MILLPNNESYVDMRNEKLVFLVTILRFGWRSYVQRQTRMYNLSYNFTGAPIEERKKYILLLNKSEIE